MTQPSKDPQVIISQIETQLRAIMLFVEAGDRSYITEAMDLITGLKERVKDLDDALVFADEELSDDTA